MNNEATIKADRLLNVKQVAKVYGDCSEPTVWRWAKAGVIPKPVKVGGRTFWKESEIISHVRVAKN